MNIRPLAVAAAVLAAWMAAPAAAAPTTYRLDGKRSTTQSYRAALSTPYVPASTGGSAEVDPTVPDTAGCAYTPSSCDIRTLRLTLPKGRSRGQLRVTVVVPTTLNAALVLYGGKNPQTDEIWRRRDSDPPPACCKVDSYTLDITIGRMPAGTYQLAVIDRAGVGEFTATVEWTAHPPDRP